MSTCLGLSLSAQSNLNDIAKEYYIIGYKTAQSNFAPLIDKLSWQISNLIASNHQLIAEHSNKLEVTHTYYSNLFTAVSNINYADKILLSAKEKRKGTVLFIAGFAAGLGSKAIYDFGRENIQISVPLIRFGN